MIVCPICLEDKTHIQLPCKHRLCITCILKWVPQTCPMCRCNYCVNKLLSYRSIEEYIYLQGRTRAQTKNVRKEIIIQYMSRCIKSVNETSIYEEKVNIVSNIIESICENEWLLLHSSFRNVLLFKLDEFERYIPERVILWRKRLFI